MKYLKTFFMFISFILGISSVNLFSFAYNKIKKVNVNVEKEIDVIFDIKNVNSNKINIFDEDNIFICNINFDLKQYDYNFIYLKFNTSVNDYIVNDFIELKFIDENNNSFILSDDETLNPFNCSNGNYKVYVNLDKDFNSNVYDEVVNKIININFTIYGLLKEVEI